MTEKSPTVTLISKKIDIGSVFFMYKKSKQGFLSFFDKSTKSIIWAQKPLKMENYVTCLNNGNKAPVRKKNDQKRSRSQQKKHISVQR